MQLAVSVSEFFKEFQQGKYRGLVEITRSDPGLIMCFRGDYVSFYYKSMRILEISVNGRYDIDSHYGVPCPSDDTDWKEYFKEAKQAINRYCNENNQEKAEKEIQQLIVKENNSGSICNATDYFIIDTEYTQSGFKGRFDALGVHWPKNKRKNAEGLSLSFMEIKAGEKAISGSSGLFEHYRSFFNFTEYLSKDDRKEEFLKDTENVIKQIRLLDLWSNSQNRNEITLSRTAKPSLVFILSNYNPRSTLLDKEIVKIKEFMRTHNSEEIFDIYFATSSFTGYGLYDPCMQSLESVCEQRRKIHADMYKEGI